MSEGIQIRLSRPADLLEVGDITVRGYAHEGFVRPSDSYATTLRDAARREPSTAQLWVAVRPSERQRLLGSVTFCPLGSPYRELAADDEGEFRMLAVDPSARGRGVGRALAAHCVIDRSSGTWAFTARS